ncbi:MAG: hypothetical protein A2X94_10450 [Bdellovibrionales bacterium GWB1_55_8]|nr:MAG: hypothetical protein A2X94_10450 [Bdellovibrionales bacterium GWB1_55_8]
MGFFRTTSLSLLLCSTGLITSVSASEIVHPSCSLVMDLKLVRKAAEYRINFEGEMTALGYHIRKSTLYPSDQARSDELYLVSLPFAIIRDPNSNRVGCKCGFEIMERYEELEKSGPVMKDRDISGVVSSYSEFSCTFALEELIGMIPPCRVSK